MFKWFFRYFEQRQHEIEKRPTYIDEEIWNLLKDGWVNGYRAKAYRTEKWRLLNWRTLEAAVNDGDREKAVGALYSFLNGDFI